jgi:hypothetical protein
MAHGKAACHQLLMMMAGRALSCVHSVQVGSVQGGGRVALVHDMAMARASSLVVDVWLGQLCTQTQAYSSPPEHHTRPPSVSQQSCSWLGT